MAVLNRKWWRVWIGITGAICPEYAVCRSAGVIATLWQLQLASCPGPVGQVDVERMVTLQWALRSSASGFFSTSAVSLKSTCKGYG